MVTAEPVYLTREELARMSALAETTDATDRLGPVSLAESRTSDQSERAASSSPGSLSGDDYETAAASKRPQQPQPQQDCQDDHGEPPQQEPDQGEPPAPVKCSAVHTLERDMPDYDYSAQVDELRALILEHARDNPGLFAQADLDKCRADSWFLSRFLLRQKMSLPDALDMLKKALRFNNESLASHLRPEDFPAEFYQLAGIFPHGQDRKGNRMLYMRVRVHRKTPEIQAIVQAFIYHNIKRLDEEAEGRGISLVIDCSGAGLASADMDLLLFIISTLKNYFPKGLSYFLVHEIPWILKPFWHIAKAWVPDEHRQLIKFSDARTLHEFVAPDQLPDYLGGRGRGAGDYRRVPENCTTLEQAAKLWGIERPLMCSVLAKFREHLPAETVARIDRYLATESGGQTTAADSDSGSDDGLVADQEQEAET